MNLDKKIKILSELIDGCEQLGDYQDGWEKDIENGKEFLKILIQENEIELKQKKMNNKSS